MRPSSPPGARRTAAWRVAPVAGLALLLGSVLVPAAGVCADGERLHVELGFARAEHRFNSHQADSAGLSFGSAYSGEVNVDFRVFDVPMKRPEARPALYVTAGALTDERTIGGSLPGQPLTRPALLVLRSGVHLLVPLEMVQPNAGVALRLGWEGSYVLGRTGGSEFLTSSKLRVGFERTAGWLAGSCVEVGMGRDETFGSEYASKRWDVHLGLQGRLLPPLPRVTRPRAGAPAAAGTAAPATGEASRRLLWAFADVLVDTDGNIGPDGLSMRVGLATDVGAVLQTVFSPIAR